MIASLIALPGGAGSAVALADGGNSSAVAINTRDDSFVFKLTFAILQAGNVVDNQNAAVAYANCTACQTVAISIQTVLVSGDPSTIAPVNEAIALNQNCDQCDTLAIAYQFVVGIGTRLKFTADGRQQIADIRHQLEMLRNSGLTGPQIDDTVNTLMTEYAGVLQSQLIPVSQPAAGQSTSGPSATAAPTDAAPTSPASASTGPTATTSTTPNSSSTTPATPAPTSTTPTTTTTTTTTTPTDTTSTTTSSTATPTSTATTTTP